MTLCARRALRSPARLLTASTLLVASLTSAGNALATPSLAEKATAQALFEDGLQLMGAKRYAEACPKLEESERLDPALGTRFRLSECEEAVGRLASAWAGFLEVADLAHSVAQTDREAVARARAATIEPKLSKVRVDVASPETPGLEVAHGSVTVGRGQWGTPVPIDPGTYTITATAPGKKPWRGSVTVAADASVASLVVPALDDATPGAATGAGPVVVVTQAAPVPTAETSRSGMKVAGITLIGVGVVGLATGTVLGLVAKSRYDGAAADCHGTVCNAAGKSTTDSARNLANVSTAVFVAGAAAGVAGVVVVVLSPSPSKRTSTRAALRFAPGSLFLEGSF